jgi:hypothetical protein
MDLGVCVSRLGGAQIEEHPWILYVLLATCTSRVGDLARRKEQQRK